MTVLPHHMRESESEGSEFARKPVFNKESSLTTYRCSFFTKCTLIVGTETRVKITGISFNRLFNCLFVYSCLCLPQI